MIYRLTYCNKEGVEARVDIQKGLATPVIEVEGTERPFILSYNNDKGDKSGMFLSSSADIEIYETPDFNIDNLKTSNETELTVTHYINNVVSWQGFIIPDFFSIEVRNNPVITMTASDRLGTLKNVTLSDLPSMISLRELAILCLNKTGLELPLRTMADFNSGTGTNDFFNSKILTQRLSDTKGRSISCYDILSSILTASNSFLVQRSGGWHIINKIQHEAGSGKLYTGERTFVNWSDVIFNFSDINVGGRRTIIPVASTVGVFHEFGGGRLHPENYDFSKGVQGWIGENGFAVDVSENEIKSYTRINNVWNVDYGDTDKNRLKITNIRSSSFINLDLVPYAQSTFPIITTNKNSVEIEINLSVLGMPFREAGFVVLAHKGNDKFAFNPSSGAFETYDPQARIVATGIPKYLIRLEIPVADYSQDKTTYEASTKSVLYSSTFEADDLTGYSVSIRVYGTDSYNGRVIPMFVNFANVRFKNTQELPKGNIYKTEKGDNFTKAHDIDTSLFADYLTAGLNGYFYDYSIDDTSSLYNSANELTSKWTAYNDTEQLPLLQHITRQKSRLFSVAHDLLSAEIEVSNFDPLAIFVACEKRYTVVSAQFDFFKSNLSVELEEVAFQSANVRDYVYSYFGDGESGIKSIGGISGGSGGGGTGGGLTPEQLEILSFWKKDPDNPDTIFTEYNAYSTKELSAYGLGSGSGGGGSLVVWGTESNGTIPLTVEGISKTIALKSGLDLKQDKLIAGSGITITGSTISANIQELSWDNISGKPLTYTPSAHTHNASDIDAGVLGIARIPTGTTGTTVALGNHTHTFASITSKPTTLSGYGITNAYTKTEVDTKLDAKVSSVGLTAPTGFSVSNSPITSTGNIALAFATGYSLPTTAKQGQWDTAYSERHTHSNKTVIDKLKQSNIDVLAKLSIVNGNLQIDGNAYATGELSAYGIGSGSGGGGGIIETVYGYGNLGQTFNNANLTDTFNAYTINQINTRLISVESGSATTVNTTGTGNAITSISKSGTVITANKGSTFSLSTHNHDTLYKPIGYAPTWGEVTGKPSTFAPSAHNHPISDITNLQTALNSKLETSIFNTHNTDSIRHITGAERTKWDGVVTDFGNLEIGGRNLINKSNLRYRYGTLTSNDTRKITGEGKWFIDTQSGFLPNTTYTISNKNIENTGFSGKTLSIVIFDEGISTRKQSIGSLESGGYRTFTTNSEIIDTDRLLIYISNDTIGEFELEELKIEKGNKPTDWTPAPEDQVSDWLTTDVNSFSYIKNKPTLLSQFTDNIGVATHIANTSNPHSVTKAQVGLGSVDNTPDSAKNVLSATKLQTPRKIWGQSFDGTGNVSGALSGATTIAASISVTAPKVIFNSAGWSMEQVGSELQMKHNNVLKMRFTSAGSIVATNEITAFG